MQGILVWLQPFTVNLEDLEMYVLAHSSERENSDSEGDASKVETQKNGSIVFMAYFRKNQKRSILRAEKYGDLITAEHKVLNEGRESRNNHRYAVVEQVLATQWNPSSPCEIGDFPWDGEKFVKILGAVAQTESCKNRQLDGIWESMWRFNMESPHFNTSDWREMALLKEPFDEWKKVLQHYCYKPGLNERWWSDSMECCCHLRDAKDLPADLKTPYERRFGEPFQGPMIKFGATIIRFHRENKQEFINLSRTYFQESFLPMS